MAVRFRAHNRGPVSPGLAQGRRARQGPDSRGRTIDAGRKRGEAMALNEWNFLSVTLGSAGLFFICCATLQRKPKHILEELFGVYKGGLRSLKLSVFKKNQLVLGFCVVLLALVVNLWSAGLPQDPGSFTVRLGALGTTALFLATLLLLSGVLNYFCRVWSKWYFRKLVHQVVTEHRWPFEKNLPLTLEIGELLGVPRGRDDTVEAFVAKVRSHLRLPETPEPARRTTAREFKFDTRPASY